MNKCLTILLNVAIWDQHATPGGILSLCVCLAGGIIYQQSPMRGEKPAAEKPPEADDEAFKTEMSEDDEEGGEDVSLLEKGSQGATKRRG